MKKMIVFLSGLVLFGFLMFDANVPALANHLQDPCDPFNLTTSNVYGHTVSEFSGKTAYSNGACRGTGDGDYQCVEFVDRYFARQDWVGNGGEYFSSASLKGLAPISNGSTLMPKPEDILGFEKPGTVGHVAIVTAVTQVSATNHEVHIIEQNYSFSGETTLPMVRLNNGGYSVLSRDGFTIQGCFRYFPPPTI
ncbi:MAG: CHAP domain-containing protein, partial [Patescibacteria group bacterium]